MGRAGRRVRVVNESRGSMLGHRVEVADSWWRRLRGLLGRPEPGAGGGLLLLSCRGVHMAGMRYALDVALVDDAGRVVALYPGLEPWRRTRYHREACHAIELPSGALGASGTRQGDSIRWIPEEEVGE